MPRKPLIRSDFLPYHVTARANNREDFQIGLDGMWKILADEMYLNTLLYGVEVHAFVMMPNHFHLLITVPKVDLGTVMNGYLSYVTRTANLVSGRSGRVFGARYHWTLINSGQYYSHALKYVYRNPAKANLCEKAEEYKYSTLQGMCGLGPLPFPLYYPRCGHGISRIPSEIENYLKWLNRPFPNEIQRSIRNGFRRSIFEIPKDKNTRIAPNWIDSLI